MTKRGTRRPTTRDEAVARALKALSYIPIPPDPTVEDAGNRPIEYRLSGPDGGYNGGDDPYAIHCASWSFGGRTPTADCIGYMLHSSGIDRLQPGYKGSVGEYLHCGSLLADARGAQQFCKFVADDKALAGDWLMDEGHCSMIIRPAIYVGGHMRFDHLVADCSPRHGRPTAIGLGAPWSEAARVVRYKLYTNDESALKA